MADVKAAPPPQTPAPQTMVWAASGLRRITLAFAILLLLPFYVSIGPMLFNRARHGLALDTLSLAILGACFTVIMGLLLIQLIHAVRNRVVISTDKVTFTLPRVTGAIAATQMVTRSIPFSEIRAVETRDEIYGGALAPVRLTATRVITREGEPVVLGFSNPENTDQTFPFPKIGALIAERAGVTVASQGAVRRSATSRLLGHSGRTVGQDTVATEELLSIKTRHAIAMRAVIAGFVVLMLGGIAIDALTASRTAYAPLTADAQAVPAPKKK